MSWDSREHQRRKQLFVANRREFHPLAMASTLIFGATWLSGWLFSAALLKQGVNSMPLRYALAFLGAYLVFFGCVRLWCEFIQRDRGSGSDGSVLDGFMIDEGCLWVLAVLVAATLPVLVFWLTGGFSALLEVAFEVAFAGTVVRRLGRTEMIGSWARALLVGTWVHALVALVVLVATAAVLQRAVPDARTFAAAVKAMASR